MHIVGNIAYVADAFGGLRMLVVSDPTRPAELGGCEMTAGHAATVTVVDNMAYVADRNWGLRVVDVSDPAAPAQIGSYAPLGYAAAVAVSGDHAYVAAATYGLRVVDISNPAHPAEVGAYDTRGNAIGVAVVGNYAYVAVMCPDPDAGLHVVDISDPAHPTRVGYRPQIQGCYRDIAVTGGVAYMPNEWGLELINVSSPHTPTLLGYIELQGEEWTATTGVDVSGTLAYVAGDRGLDIVDVSNPASPTLRSTFRDAQWVKGVDVAIAGTTAYVTHHGGDGLKIVDVSDPLHAAQIGAYSAQNLPERLIVANGTAYVAFGGGGLHAVDISDPAQPILVCAYDTPGYATASAVAGDQVYVADGQAGLVILEMGAAQQGASTPTDSEPACGVTDLGSTSRSQPPILRLTAESSHLRHGKNEIGGQGQSSPVLPLGTQVPLNLRTGARTCVVTSPTDSGPGTLRECMENAVSGDIITFDSAVFPPQSPVTIALQEELPPITCSNLTLDASEAGVILDGSDMQGGVGLDVQSSNNTIRGLQVVRFSHCGINLSQSSSSNNVIGGDRTVGSGPLGQGNLISGNGMGGGIFIAGNNNTIVGNLIGTDAGGLRAFEDSEGFFHHGIFVQGGSYNRIGGTSPGEKNIISGNGGSGIVIHYATGNIVVGNYIGTDVGGAAGLGNGEDGVTIELGSFHNVVKGNLISGNSSGGVRISDWPSSYNTIVANLIGTDSSGMRALGNRGSGVAVGWGGASFNRIGGTSPGDGNVISGNRVGIELHGREAGNLILGNLIGTNIVGTEAIPNARGISMIDDSSHNFVGGTTDAERNVISGNDSLGIEVMPGERNFILGNYVGTDASGTVALGNAGSGITMDGAKHTTIQSNLVAGNEAVGVRIECGSSFNHLRASRIGVAADGASPLANGWAGVRIQSPSNTVGGPYPSDANIIAFNHGDGVEIWSYTGNTIRGNSIYSNSGSGISLLDGGNNLLPAPVITAVTETSVSGTACPGCIVEIFSNAEDEGRIYEGSTVADASAAFHFAKASDLTGPYITATATDGDGNTSEFSVPKLLARHRVWLPVILKRP